MKTYRIEATETVKKEYVAYVTASDPEEAEQKYRDGDIDELDECSSEVSDIEINSVEELRNS